MNKHLCVIIFCILCLLPCSITTAQEKSYQMIDEMTGNLVYVTGWKIRVGDEFLTVDNKRYEIVKIQGEQAKVRYIGEIKLTKYWLEREGQLKHPFLSVAMANEKIKKVAVYHTHSDEAYIPSDGTESDENGNGGILKVGNVFSEILEQNGIESIHSTTSHIPHDDMAYERSRRTVVQLLKEQPDAIFDIHRDATPPEAYQAKVAGEDIAQVQLVVGKYGPTGKEIEEYALQMKAVSDNQYPGLVKGIFFAKGGDYNQDLHPKSMLVEVGSHTNNRVEAERGITLLANTIPAVLGVTSTNNNNTKEENTGVDTKSSGISGSVKSMGYIVAFLVAGVIIFIFISTGSMKEAGAKVNQFMHHEFQDVLPKSEVKNFRKNDEDKQKK